MTSRRPSAPPRGIWVLALLLVVALALVVARMLRSDPGGETAAPETTTTTGTTEADGTDTTTTTEARTPVDASTTTTTEAEPDDEEEPQRVFFLAPDGDDGAPGTEERPWRDVARALERLQPGDTLLLREGTYRQEVRPARLADGQPDRRITVSAYPGERPVIQGRVRLEDPDYWTFRGMNVRWDPESDDGGHMVEVIEGTGWEYLDSELWGSEAFSALLVTTRDDEEPAEWRVAGNCIHDTVGSDSHGSAEDQLLYINTGSTSGPGIVEGNLLFNAPRGKAIKLGGPSEDTGSSDVVVRFNTISNTNKPSIVVAWETRNSEIYRNILVDTDDRALIRGFELTGEGNEAWENLGSGAPDFISSDSGFPEEVGDGGGNRLVEDLGFNHTDGCDGFVPAAEEASGYGHLAGVEVRG